MRTTLLLLAALVVAPAVHAHNVLPNNNTLSLSLQDPLIEDVTVQHFTGEDCIVSANLQAAPPAGQALISIGAGKTTGLDVWFIVGVLRNPANGVSETTTVSGSWKATGDNTSGQHEDGCDGSGTISMTVTVYQNKPPTLSPTVSAVANPGVGNDPVSTATGELFGYDDRPDLDLGGPMDLRFHRYYSSYLTTSGSVFSALGPNWMHNFDVRMTLAGNVASVTLFRAKQVTFTQSAGAWQLNSTEQRPYQLAAVGGGFQFLDPQSNWIYTFDGTGALTAISDRNGNTLTVTQAPGGVGPAQVSDGLGRTLTFAYNGSSLAGVHDQAGRTVNFTYDGVTLAAWTNANGKQTAFAYTQTANLFALMTAATRPLQNRPFTQAFDAQGRVSTQFDSFNNSVQFTYASSNGGATLAEPGSVTVTQANDANFNVTSVGDPSGATSKYGYDSGNRPASTTDRLGNKESAVWDAASGMPTSYTDALGNTTTWTYASSTAGPFTFYDLASVHLADGSTVSFTRDSHGNVTASTDQAGNTWQATRTAAGQPATLTNPSGGVTTYTYGNDGTLTSVQEPSGDTKSIAYDSASRPNLITNADSSTVSLSYDAQDNVVRQTNEAGKTAQAIFDANDRGISVTDPLSATKTLAWDTDDRLISTTDATGHATTQTWDSSSRVRSVANAAGNTVTYAYDTLNRVTGLTDVSGNGFTFTRDAEGRLLSIVDALSRTAKYSRDARGSVTGFTTPNNEKFTRALDALGRAVSTTDALNRVARYQWEPRGLLSASTLPGGISASVGYNEMGLPNTVTDPDGNVWKRSFDKMGRPVSTADPLGQATSVQYDARQRIASAAFPTGTVQYQYDSISDLTALTYSDGTSLSYTYDADGRLTGGSGLAIGYDAAGRITSSNGLQITRDAAGRIASVTYASGKTVNYTYNNRGFLVQVADWVGGTTVLAYDAAGQLTSVNYPNGVSQTNTYDLNGRPLTLNLAKSGTAISSITITRDALGRVTAASRSAANVPDDPTGTLALAYDAGAQILGATYDPLGRLTKDAIRTYAWDLASRLSSYSGADGAATFKYDATGQRISRTSGGAIQSYVLNYAFPLPVASTVQVNGSDQTYYIWLPDGTLLASIAAADNTRHFYHFDESGSTIALTDGASGAVTDSYAVTPYGEIVTQTGGTANPFVFHGKLGVMREGSTSLYYMRARYYDSTSARFIARDPASLSDVRAINPYQFVYGNPIERTDPSGLELVNVNGELLDFNDPSNIPKRHGPSVAPPPSREPDPFDGGLPGTFFAPQGNPPAGTPSFGTRLRAVFNNIPDNVQIFVPVNGNAVKSGAPVSTLPLGTSIQSISGITIPSFAPSITNLLSALGTNAPGFYTGLSIANTSTDPFGTAPQCGTCTLNWYSAGIPSAATVPDNPPPALVPFTVSSVAPGFQGYMIAACPIQAPSSFSFVTSGLTGSGGLAAGYPGGIIPGPMQGTLANCLTH